MPLPYAQNKQHIYNTRKKNSENYKLYMREFMRYKRSPEYEYEKITKIFRHILF